MARLVPAIHAAMQRETSGVSVSRPGMMSVSPMKRGELNRLRQYFQNVHFR
jgi:hypothetical protein